MKTTFLQSSLPIFLFVLLATCGTPQPVVETTKKYPNVDQRLWSYFEKFEVEAAKRQQNIPLSHAIIGKIETIPSSTGAVGLCNHLSGSNHVIIDKHFWKTSSQLQKEMIVFHELGHCALNRSHRDTEEGGICKSIMRSGPTFCIANYSNSTREKYIDELFTRAD